ncbi:MAG: hypothetical protein J6A75_03740 [Lachnospiraceae bacterium]|nr:hypothetical protein [Lachnospiraceae bacterium]
MFHAIDYENWDRKEIYEAFESYTYCVSVELDITNLRRYMKETERKFYPLICWIITKTANEDMDYRIVKHDGQIGYFDKLHTSYTLLRNANPHLFIHMVTEYDEDLNVYYERFLKDKALAEAEDRLYYYTEMRQDNVDVSIMPHTSFKAISYCMPTSFYQKDPNNMRYTPFTTVGKFFERDGKVILPVTTNFHHAVNDGYHVEKFFRKLQENLDTF